MEEYDNIQLIKLYDYVLAEEFAKMLDEEILAELINNHLPEELFEM